MPPTLVNNPLAGLLPALLIACALIQGCSQWRYDLGDSLSRAQTPAVDDNLSLAAVLDQLGPPIRISATANGYVLAWEHWRIKEDSIGLSLGPMGAELMSIDWGDARMKGEFILATFDHEHRLTGSAFSTWDSDAGGGAAVQPFLGASVVDVGDMVGRMPHHRWGAASLDRLPVTLNASSRPDMGQSGIQQRGTPTGIGQQSLEMD
jgi:hypothetical protein